MQLINSINGSVDALDGLFSELLDITKIDTGGVEARPTDFQLDEVFRKIKLHFEPIAFEKGLLLHVRGGHRHAYADPLLVERIVRNLTVNAIRYTNDGGVLHAHRGTWRQVVAAGLGHRRRHSRGRSRAHLRLSRSCTTPMRRRCRISARASASACRSCAACRR
jgi:hypothetical protein